MNIGTSLSALNAFSVQMNVTANNLANVNTIGYKGQRTTFVDELSQVIRGASGPTSNNGGTNPMEVGLGAMVVLSVLPVGLLQTWAAVDKGYWYARSAEFLHTPLMDTLRWMRVIGDTVFAAGAIAFGVAVAQLTLKPDARPERARTSRVTT